MEINDIYDFDGSLAQIDAALESLKKKRALIVGMKMNAQGLIEAMKKIKELPMIELTYDDALEINSFDTRGETEAHGSDRTKKEARRIPKND